MKQSSSSLKRHDLYLTSEERFQVWQVKVAERPELVDVYQPQDDDDDRQDEHDAMQQQQQKQQQKQQNKSNNVEDEESVPLPLTDGCDLPSWRQGRLVRASQETESCCHVGMGCRLLRLETQVPMVMASRQVEHWHTLRERLYRIPKQSCCSRLDATDAACHNLHPWFERQNVPVLLDAGVTDTWPARTTYRWEALLHRFGASEWRVSDTHAETLTLHTFTKYATTEGMLDDAPLALYDSQFHLDERASLVQDYTVPTCFSQDLYALLDLQQQEQEQQQEQQQHDENQLNDDSQSCIDCDSHVSRPPFRWILMGGARSGTGLHVDPVGTHAWVTLVQGIKRWVLFPPHVDCAAIGMQTPQIPSALWFRDWYDKVMSIMYAQDQQVVHVLQRPGETVYVPAGWPHIVLNLEPSVAVTENYATPYPSVSRLLRAANDESPALGRALRDALAKYRPDLIIQKDDNLTSNGEDEEEKKLDAAQVAVLDLDQSSM